MAKILIKNGRVWDGERFFHADVLIEGMRVEKIEREISDDAATLFDATGKTVSAGLVDAHVHMRGISTDKYGTGADMSCLPFGVTAAADASGEQGDAALLDSFVVKSAVFIKGVIRDNRAVFSKAEDALSRFGNKVVGVKVYFDDTMSEVSDVTPLREICDYAHRKGLRVMVHCAHSPVSMAQILQTLSAGDILTHAFHGGKHSAAEDGFASMREAQARGVVIDVGFAGHVHTDFEVFRKAMQAGVVPDTISTDVTRLSSYVRGGRYGMTMCMSMARHMGISEEDIFRAVTLSPAKTLGKETEWGRLTAGGVADVTVLDHTQEGFDLTDKAGNRICADKGYRCVLTVSNGQVVFRD